MDVPKRLEAVESRLASVEQVRREKSVTPSSSSSSTDSAGRSKRKVPANVRVCDIYVCVRPLQYGSNHPPACWI